MRRRAFAAAAAIVLFLAPSPLPHLAPRLAAPAARAAGEPEVAALEKELEVLRARHGVPALGAALVRGGRIEALGAVGERARGSGVAVTRADLWHVGSCTKAMTAALCARLVQDGKLKWDLTVAEAFRDDVATIDPGWRKATLEHLLRNRGGAPAALDEGGLWARLWRHEGTPREARLVLARGLLPLAPKYEPGTKMVYANANFALAGAMAERALDRPYEDLLREKVFAPLGAKSPGFGAPGTAGAKTPDQPLGHREDGTPVPRGPGDDNPPGIAPAGTVHLSLEDLARWAAFQVRGARGEEKTLAAETWKRLHAPPEGGDYAMGWRVRGTRDLGRELWHNGSNTMWYASVAVYPERDLAVVVACNAGGKGATAAVTEAGEALARRAPPERK